MYKSSQGQPVMLSWQVLKQNKKKRLAVEWPQKRVSALAHQFWSELVETELYSRVIKVRDQPETRIDTNKKLQELSVPTKRLRSYNHRIVSISSMMCKNFNINFDHSQINKYLAQLQATFKK